MCCVQGHLWFLCSKHCFWRSKVSWVNTSVSHRGEGVAGLQMEKWREVKVGQAPRVAVSVWCEWRLCRGATCQGRGASSSADGTSPRASLFVCAPRLSLTRSHMCHIRTSLTLTPLCQGLAPVARSVKWNLMEAYELSQSHVDDIRAAFGSDWTSDCTRDCIQLTTFKFILFRSQEDELIAQTWMLWITRVTSVGQRHTNVI